MKKRTKEKTANVKNNALTRASVNKTRKATIVPVNVANDLTCPWMECASCVSVCMCVFLPLNLNGCCVRISALLSLDWIILRLRRASPRVPLGVQVHCRHRCRCTISQLTRGSTYPSMVSANFFSDSRHSPSRAPALRADHSRVCSPTWWNHQ